MQKFIFGSTEFVVAFPYPEKNQLMQTFLVCRDKWTVIN